MPYVIAGPWIPASFFEGAFVTHPLPDVSKFTEPPVEFVDVVEGICIRTATLSNAGDCVGQHKHSYSHANHVGHGSVRLWVDGVWVGDFKRNQTISIKANAIHIFQALEDDTSISCLTIASVAEGT